MVAPNAEAVFVFLCAISPDGVKFRCHHHRGLIDRPLIEFPASRADFSFQIVVMSRK
jgi:hypothetical protein